MKIQKTLGAGILSLGLVVGMAGFAGAAPGTINDTGSRSNNQIRTRTAHRVDVDNDTDVDVRNGNFQDAWTGHATVRDNNRGGSAQSGHATNTNSFSGTVRVNNSTSTASALAPVESGDVGGGDISNTGSRSNNQISSSSYTSVDVDNDTDIDVRNFNIQRATSGDATVHDNTRGGDAISGNASNTNSTSLTFEVTN